VAEACAASLSHGRADGDVTVTAGLLSDVPYGGVLVSVDVFGEILGGDRGDDLNTVRAGDEQAVGSKSGACSGDPCREARAPVAPGLAPERTSVLRLGRPKFCIAQANRKPILGG
jgi:hypothetical protein